MTTLIGTRRSRARGFSLVELLVGVMIGLIAIVVISQMYSVAEDRKRSATGSSDAQIAGNIATFSIERFVRMAGWGLSGQLLLGCTTLAYNSQRSPTDFSFAIRPVVIDDGAASAPDAITVMYSGSPGITVLDGNVLNGAAASGADFALTTVSGFAVGDLVIAAEGGKNCSLAEVTAIPGGTNTLQHSGGTYNKGGGLGVAYTTSGQIFKVGRKAYDSSNPNLAPFSIQRFRIVNDTLRMESLIPYSPATDTDSDGFSDYPLASGVVQLQALYGKDDGTGGLPHQPDDGVVDNFDAAVPANITAWRQTLILRVAMLVRTGKWEKDAVTCDLDVPSDCIDHKLAPKPMWYAGNTATKPDPACDANLMCPFKMTNPADGTDWRHYRYRVYQTDIPLRNMLWKPPS